MINGLPPEAATFRVDGQQWTTRDELMAILVERVDHWGLAQAYIHSNGKGLPEKSIEIPRPSVSEGSATESRSPADKTEKDRYEKQRERIAFFA